MGLVRFLVVTAAVMGSILLVELADLSIFLTELGWWSAGLVLIVYVLVFEKESFSSLGLHAPSVSTLTTAAIGFVLCLFGVAAFGMLTLVMGVDARGTEERLAETAAAPIWWLILVFLRAGVVEELVFRGYVISRAINLGASRWFALALSTGLFVLPHAFFWPGPSLVMVAFTGLALGSIFIWKRDLVACILAHTGVNMGGVIASSFA